MVTGYHWLKQPSSLFLWLHFLGSVLFSAIFDVVTVYIAVVICKWYMAV